MKKKITEKQSEKKATSTTKKMMSISKTGLKKAYPENKRTRIVDSGFLGKGQAVPKKLAKKNKTK